MDSPLFPHQTGRWAKKVRGRFCYFGKIADDPEGKAALKKWLAVKDDSTQGIMGHAPASGDTGSVYRQKISDERLRRVVGHVRRWLFGDKKRK